MRLTSGSMAGACPVAAARRRRRATSVRRARRPDQPYASTTPTDEDGQAIRWPVAARIAEDPDCSVRAFDVYPRWALCLVDLDHRADELLHHASDGEIAGGLGGQDRF